MRTLVDIPDDDIRWLDRAAADAGTSRTAMVREAVASLRAGRSRRAIDDYFGMWRDRSDIPDGIAYQRLIRCGAPR